jgi:hypothetical protein
MAWQRGQSIFHRIMSRLWHMHACSAYECIDIDAMVAHGVYMPLLHVPAILVHGNILSSAGFIMWGSEQLPL